MPLPRQGSHQGTDIVPGTVFMTFERTILVPKRGHDIDDTP